MKLRRDPFPDLPPVSQVIVDGDRFSRRDVAVMFGNIDPSIIRKDCSVLDIEPYETLSREDVWKLYVLNCFKRVHPGAHRKTFVRLCEEKGDKVALEYVNLAGGSKEHFQSLLEQFVIEKRMRPLSIA